MKLIEQIQQLDFPAPLPEKLLVVEQRFAAPHVHDVVASTREAMRTFTARIQPGETVAVGVGSRGIANLPVIVCAAIDALRECGARPFVMPAMGSHGGATCEGQIGVLADLGATRDNATCPSQIIKSSTQ